MQFVQTKEDFAHASAISEPVHKFEIVQILDAHRNLAGTGFLVYDRARRPQIVTAAHVIMMKGDLSKTASRPQFFVRSIDPSQGQAFPVLPKKYCAVGDACFLMLQNEDDMEYLLKTTKVFELASKDGLDELARSSQDNGIIAWFKGLTNSLPQATIFGGYFYQWVSKIYRAVGPFLGFTTNDALFYHLNPLLKIKATAFGGISGGPLIFKDKVVGIFSDPYIMSIDSAGRLAMTASGVAVCGSVLDIWAALDRFSASADAPFASLNYDNHFTQAKWFKDSLYWDGSKKEVKKVVAEDLKHKVKAYNKFLTKMAINNLSIVDIFPNLAVLYEPALLQKVIDRFNQLRDHPAVQARFGITGKKASSAAAKPKGILKKKSAKSGKLKKKVRFDETKNEIFILP